MNKIFEETDQFEILSDGRKFSYSDYGKASGVPIFQFHGTPGSRIFGLNNDEIVRAGLRIICPERPGYGQTSSCVNYNFFDWSQDVKVLATRLNLERFHVLGVSGGGAFALACAAYLPECVISTTVVSSSAPISFPSFWVGISRANRALFFVSSRYPRVLSLICGALSILKKDYAGVKTHEGEAFCQGGIGLETDLLILSRNWKIPFELIANPVFMWHGEHDTLASPNAARQLAKSIPNCEYHSIEDGGHFIGRDPSVSKRILDRLMECK